LEKSMTPKSIFEEQITSRLEAAKEIDSVYQFNVSGDEGGDWVVDLKAGKVYAGSIDDADCTIGIEGEDLVGLVKGDVQGPQLFMMGKLAIAGDMSLAMKLGDILG
jgi:putative sterol carrier protein